MSDQGCPIVGRKEKVKADESQAAKPAPEVTENLKLDLGGGEVSQREGFTSVDRRNGTELYPLPYPDECVAEAISSHCLEHFPKSETINVLREWVRVLKPGGTIKIAVPDFEWICANLDHPLTEGYVMGGQTDENDFHHALFNREKLTKLMELAGLVDIFPWVSEVEDCASLPVTEPDGHQAGTGHSHRLQPVTDRRMPFRTQNRFYG